MCSATTAFAIGQRGRICTCGHPVPSRACCFGAPGGGLGFGARAAGYGAAWGIKNQNSKIKNGEGRGAFVPPARAISTKNKHLLAIYSIPTRGFTAAVSVFRGTPPAKPFNCKIWNKCSGARIGAQRAHPIG